MGEQIGWNNDVCEKRRGRRDEMGKSEERIEGEGKD